MENMKTKKKQINEVSIVAWQDSAYSFQKKLPRVLPKTQFTFGYIMKENKKFIHIATNVSWDISSNKKPKPADGFFIPRGAIIAIKRAKFV